MKRTRNLVVVFGDQLDVRSSALDDFDVENDAVAMMEVADEATRIPQHSQRLVLFFAAMRHFRDTLRARGFDVVYTKLEDRANHGSIEAELRHLVLAMRPQRLVVVQPGEYRLASMLHRLAAEATVDLEIRDDRHFFCDRAHFDRFQAGKKTLVMENFYRQIRRGENILMDKGKPLGGRWNYDSDNRASLRSAANLPIPHLRQFAPLPETQRVIKMVRRVFPESPGDPGKFDYPTTPEQAITALDDFVRQRLPNFGRYQDAMLEGEAYLFHSRLSSSLNLRLLDPRRAVEAAVDAYARDEAPLAAVEGFVRQIIGWREFIRGIYLTRMPEYAEFNALEADLPMPAFMWTSETDMNCLRQCVLHLIEHAYAHHIQRLMVLGLFALLLGVRPTAVNRWHLSMYIDAVDWVSLPNVLGMSQYADGGVVATKPYCASGAYIHRMSDYCKGCRYNPRSAQGDDACPITTLYWDFLARHRDRFRENRRMGFQIVNLERKPAFEIAGIRRAADRLRSSFSATARQ